MEHQTGSADRQLLLAQAGWVQGLAHNLVSDPAGAEDVAQDTMLAALAAPRLTGDDERTLRAWLTRVATNLALLTRRRSSRRLERETRAARPEQVCSAAESVERAAQLQAVIEAVLGLDEPYRSAVLLRYYDGLSPNQIAERTGATPVAVRKRISRGLERLRASMDREHGGDRSSWMPAMLAFADAPGALSPPALFGSAARAATGAATPLQLAAVVAAALTALTLAGSSLLTRAPRADVAALPTVAAVAPAGLGQRVERTPVLPPVHAAPAQAARAPLGLRRTRSDEGREPWRSRALGEEGEPPAEQELALDSVGGRVVDLFGVGLAGLELVDARSPGEVLGVTAGDGSFDLPWSFEQPLELALGGEAFVALRRPRIEAAGAGVRHLLVATRAVRLAGWVSGPQGQPLPGATVRVNVPAAAFLELGLALDGGVAVDLLVQADGEGAFELERVPALDSALLETAAPGFATDRRPLPLLGAEALQIRLELPAHPTSLAWGVVRFANGEPAPDAEVRLGGEAHVRVTYTDGSGRFSLPIDPGPGTLVAHLAGWERGLAAVQSMQPMQSGTSGQGPTVITLGARLYSITGMLATPSGAPLSGWLVTAGPSSGSGSEAATAGPASTTTGSNGAFTLAGLPFGTYGVWAVNQATLEVGKQLAVQTGTSGVLVRAAGTGGGATVAGKLVGAQSQPLSGVLLSAAVFLPGLEDAVAVGPGVLTGSGGSFSLPGAGGEHIQVLVAGVPAAVPDPAAGSNQLGLTVVLPPVAHLVFDGSGWSTPPDTLRLLDRQGRALLLQTPAGLTKQAPLYGGKSLVLGATEAARTAVALRAGVEVGRCSADLLAGEVTTVGLEGPSTVGAQTLVGGQGMLTGNAPR